jgi:hypothetical protein
MKRFAPKESIVSAFKREGRQPITHKEKMAREAFKHHLQVHVGRDSIFYRDTTYGTWTRAGGIDELCKQEMERRMSYEHNIRT